MKQREIDKLAWEYAEKYSGDVDYGIVTSEFIRNVVADALGQFLHDHFIVSKELKELIKDLRDYFNNGDNDMVEYTISEIEELFNEE